MEFKQSFYKFYFIIILLFLIPSYHSLIIANDNVDFLLNHFEKNNIDTINSTSFSMIEAKDPLSFFGFIMIKFYQTFISSQDKPSCNFSLSCSKFCYEAIKYKGFFLGIILTADRLTRCNSLTRNSYSIDLKTKKAKDIVPDYIFNHD